MYDEKCSGKPFRMVDEFVHSEGNKMKKENQGFTMAIVPIHFE